MPKRCFTVQRQVRKRLLRPWMGAPGSDCCTSKRACTYVANERSTLIKTFPALVSQHTVRHIESQAPQHHNGCDASGDLLAVFKRFVTESQTGDALAREAGISGLVNMAVPVHAGRVHKLELGGEVAG
jgi:hypothetical protein